MYGILTYIYHKNQPNVCKYTIHGSYRIYNIYIYTLFNRENSDRQKAEMPRYDLLKKGAQGASPPNVLDKP